MAQPIVYVRYNSNAQFTVPVTSQSSVADVKLAVAQHHGVNASTIKLIFAGRDLDDGLTLADCQVETQSILHAVTSQPEVQGVPGGVPGLPFLSFRGEEQDGAGDQGAVGSPTPATPSPGRQQAKFYVYCKEETCKGVAQGKLRVRCGTCRNGGFILQQDPSCWDDVRVKGRIRGRCMEGSCAGDTAEFYFKCSRHRAGEKDNCVVLDLLQFNSYTMPCIACTEDSAPLIIVFPCDNSHVMCIECFALYGVTKLNDRSFENKPSGYTIPCPAANCNNSFIQEVHHFRLLGNPQYERYQKFGTEDFILREGGVLCPSASCGNPIPLENNHRRIQCPYCNHMFCKLCKEDFHNGACDEARSNQPPAAAVQRSQYTVSEENASMAALSRELIKDVCRNCPRCNSATEKNGGCMHMSCHCGFQWCWICQVEWGRNCQDNHWFGLR